MELVVLVGSAGCAGFANTLLVRSIKLEQSANGEFLRRNLAISIGHGEHERPLQRSRRMQKFFGEIKLEVFVFYAVSSNLSARKRRALDITQTELKLIAALAIMGLSNKPSQG